jgi:hypothetical protein
VGPNLCRIPNPLRTVCRCRLVPTTGAERHRLHSSQAHGRELARPALLPIISSTGAASCRTTSPAGVELEVDARARHEVAGVLGIRGGVWRQRVKDDNRRSWRSRPAQVFAPLMIAPDRRLRGLVNRVTATPASRSASYFLDPPLVRGVDDLHPAPDPSSPDNPLRLAGSNMMVPRGAMRRRVRETGLTDGAPVTLTLKVTVRYSIPIMRHA